MVRAARYGFSLMLAIIGGPPARFAPFSELYREALREFGQPDRPVGVHAPGHVAETDEQARAEFWPHWRTIMPGRQGARLPCPTEDDFAFDVGPEGALYVGSPETVARKIAANLGVLDASRFDLKFGMPGLTHEAAHDQHRALRQQVIPRVRELVDRRRSETVATTGSAR